MRYGGAEAHGIARKVGRGCCIKEGGGWPNGFVNYVAA
jgi:hypothetical protein